jgi:putative ABC transport system permease protein
MKRRFFRLPSTDSTLERDIDEEIDFHFAARIDELVASGLDADAARRRAEREFGDVRSARDELAAIDRTTLRRLRCAAWWDAAAYDSRQAVRGMRRHPAFTLAVMVMLALGVGVNAAMFGIADRLLLSPPAHVERAAELVRVMYEQQRPPAVEREVSATMSYPQYVALRDDVPGFDDVAAYTTPWSTSVLGRGEGGSEVRVALATSSFFTTLGVRAALGRFFTAEEDAPPQGERVVVLGHGLWQRRFGGDAAVIGTTVEIDHVSYTVVGVAPRGFNGLDLQPVDAWLPVSAVGPSRGGADWYAFTGMLWLNVVARLSPDAGREAVREQATGVFVAAAPEIFRNATEIGLLFGSAIAGRAPAVSAGSAAAAAVPRSGRIAVWLMGVSLLVLVIACVNVANLLLARGMRRHREIGVRMAMGVGRARLAAQVMTETLLLALLGTGAGLLLAHWGGQVARTLLLPGVEWGGSPVNGRVVLFAGAIAVISAVLAGTVPALHAARGDAASLLALGGRGTYRRSRMRGVLVAVQAALSVLLLVGAGLFVRSLDRAAALPLGFEPGRVTAFDWHSSGLGWDRQRLHALYDHALERVRELPDVEAAAISMVSPLSGSLYGFIRVPGLDSIPSVPDGILYNAISPGYFAATGTRVLRGRPFDERDVSGATPVVIVNASLADLLWPGEDAVGRCLVHTREQPGPPQCREVVGIAEDVRHGGILAGAPANYFLPIAQVPGFDMRTLLVRTGDSDARTLESVRVALQTLEPGLPRVRMQRLQERMDPQLQPWRLGAAMFTGLGALALLLAGLGLYGVVAYDVAQRTRELGVRAALGARAGSLVRMVLGDAFVVVALGLVTGLAAAGFAAPYIEPLLFQISPRDPVVLALVSALILGTTLAAAALPALRAARVLPTQALRGD